MKPILFLLLFFGLLLEAPAQSLPENNQDTTGHWVYGIVIGQDTFPHIYIHTIIIRPPYKFKSKRERRRYTRLTRYVKKVYPYAIIIQDKYTEINEHLSDFESYKEKKKYIKRKEKELRKEFEGRLIKLTYTQGRILIKLVDRQTGYSTYDVLKEFKGSVNAFVWQSLAVMFGSNLKSKYDASGDDKMIEDIIIRIENGQL